MRVLVDDPARTIQAQGKVQLVTLLVSRASPSYVYVYTYRPIARDVTGRAQWAAVEDNWSRSAKAASIHFRHYSNSCNIFLRTSF